MSWFVDSTVPIYPHLLHCITKITIKYLWDLCHSFNQLMMIFNANLRITQKLFHFHNKYLLSSVYNFFTLQISDIYWLLFVSAPHRLLQFRTMSSGHDTRDSHAPRSSRKRWLCVGHQLNTLSSSLATRLRLLECDDNTMGSSNFSSTSECVSRLLQQKETVAAAPHHLWWPLLFNSSLYCSQSLAWW